MYGLRNIGDRTKVLILALIAILGIVYLAIKVFPIHSEGGLDFRTIWLAGKFWASGRNPYAPAFQKEYFEIFHPMSRPAAYPLYYYPLAVTLGLLPFSIAYGIWKLINFSLLIGATYLIARALADVTYHRFLPIFLAGIGFVCFMQATAAALFVGQTSILVYFGLAAMIFGILKSRPFPLIIGLVFIALKPNIGIVAFAAVAALSRYRWTIFPAAGVCLLATAPIAFIGDFRASVAEYLVSLTQYNQFSANIPANETGLINILDHLISSALFNTLFLIAAAIICAAIVFHYSSLNNAARSANLTHQVASLSLFMTSTFFLVPLHSYDLISLAALLMMMVAVPLPGRWLTALGLLICLRPGNIWSALGIANPANLSFPESTLVSIALLLLFVVALWATFSGQSETKTAS